MQIKSVRQHVEWPGQINASASNPMWDELRGELSKLVINGTSMEVLFDDKETVSKAQAIVNYHGKKLNSVKKGWKFETTSRGTTLFIRKVALPGR